MTRAASPSGRSSTAVTTPPRRANPAGTAFAVALGHLWRAILLCLCIYGSCSGVARAQLATNTYLYTSAYSVTAGAVVTFTAGIDGVAPTGTVTFKDGTATLGTASLVAGEANLNATFSLGGIHVITAVYSGDANNAPSTSEPLEENVFHGNTTTTLSSAPNPADAGQIFRLTATVTGSNPTGSVSLFDNGVFLTSLGLVGGTATLDWAFYTASSHTFTAVFAGDYYNASSTSNAVIQTIASRTASSTVLTSSLNPTGLGQNTTLTATVTGTSPTGTVTFKDGSATIGTSTLSGGVATLTTSFSSTGTRVLTADYSGDAANTSSTAMTVQTVNTLAASKTTLASSVNPAMVGQNTTLTATVTGAAPTGTVTFKDGTTTLGTGTIAAGLASLVVNFAVGGAHNLTATYSGNATNTASTSPALTQSVFAATTTTLSSSVNPAGIGQVTTLKAIVTGSSPTGTVTFKDGTATLGTILVSSGVASLSVIFSSTGSHPLTAVYSGDTVNATSTSTVLSQTITALASSSTALSASLNPVLVGQSTTLTATVTGSAPTGTVTFKDGSTTLGTATLSAGKALFTTSFAATGAHNLTALYGGDSANATSASAIVPLTVNIVPTTTVLAVSANPVNLRQTILLTATISGSPTSGTVTFKDGATTLGLGTVTAGQASFNASFTTIGIHSLTAVYGGNSTYARSTSASVSLTVQGSASTTTLVATPNPAALNESVTLKATISGSAPTGTVTFKNDTSVLGTSALSGSSSTLTVAFGIAAHYKLTAVYSGDTNNGSSTSASVDLKVGSGGTGFLPRAPTWTYSYDAQGNRTSTTAPDGSVTTSTYDRLQRLVKITQPPPVLGAAAPTTNLTYNGRDQLTALKDPRSLSTQSPRNGLGDTTKLVSPDTGTATHTFDAAGNLKTRTDSRGVKATTTYDALSRLTMLVYSQGSLPSLTYTWAYDQTGTGFSNGVGRLTSTAHSAGSTQTTYDLQGRVLTDIQRVAPNPSANPVQVVQKASYSYTPVGRINSIVYPSGRKLRIAYASGVPVSMSLAANTSAVATPLLSAIRWQFPGVAQGWTWQLASSTQVHERVFDTAGHLLRYRLGPVMRDLSYDTADRISGYTHSDAVSGAPQAALNQSFVHDALGQLTQVTLASGAWSFTYDANGNRTSATASGSTRNYTTPASNNRLMSVSNPSRSFTYDSAGNTTSDGQFSASYDLSGRMATLSKAGVTSTYSYDGFGRRVRKYSSTGAASTVLFFYDTAGHLLGEYDSAGTAIREYVWLGDTPVAVFTPDPVSAANPPLVFYVHADHINTPRVIVDKNNQIRWRWMSEPFGINAPEENPSALGTFTFHLRFPGQYFDQESGLHYNWFRSYDSSTGRYDQFDPIGLAGGINGYTYVGGNPVAFSDPMGLQAMPTPWGPIPMPVAPPNASSSMGGGRGGYDPRTDTYMPSGTTSNSDSGNCCSSYTDVYEANNGKHGNTPRGNISAEPSNPSLALQNSIGAGRSKIGYDGLSGQIIVFRLTRTDEQKCIKYWHGYVVYQQDLTPEQWKSGRDAGFPNWPRKPK